MKSEEVLKYIRERNITTPFRMWATDFTASPKRPVKRNRPPVDVNVVSVPQYRDRPLLIVSKLNKDGEAFVPRQNLGHDYEFFLTEAEAWDFYEAEVELAKILMINYANNYLAVVNKTFFEAQGKIVKGKRKC